MTNFEKAKAAWICSDCLAEDNEGTWKFFYEAGRKAGLEEAVEILNVYEYTPDLPEVDLYDQVAAAIRGRRLNDTRNR